MLDIGAVMDAVGSERAALFGLSEGASISVVFAATFPERTRALILFGGVARFLRAPDYPFRPSYDFMMKVFMPWGSGKSVERLVQTQAANPTFRELWAKLERLCVSPGGFREMLEGDVPHRPRGGLDDARAPQGDVRL